MGNFCGCLKPKVKENVPAEEIMDAVKPEIAEIVSANFKENTDADADADANVKQNTDANANSQIIWVDQSTGKKACMLSATVLDIKWGDDPEDWSWVKRDDSRFGQVAEAHGVRWFDISKRFDCGILSPDTKYSVSFVVKIDKSRLLSNPPFMFKLKTVEETVIESARFLDDLERGVETYGQWKMTPVKNGENEWMELDAGEFFLKENGGSGNMEIEFCMYNTDGVVNPHDGIFIDGVKIQPKQ